MLTRPPAGLELQSPAAGLVLGSIPRDEELGPHTRHRYSNVFHSLTARVLVVTLVDKELFTAGPFCWL
ncbi:unnamed protein product [Gadus morhua 'NCC']